MKRIIESLTGLFLLSVTYNLVFLPNKIVAGGEEGIATTLSSLINPSTTIFVVNIGVLILSFIFLGKKKTKDFIIGSLCFPLFIVLTKDISSTIDLSNTSLFLQITFSAALNGLGLGLVIRNGFSTGGTDVLSQIISKKKEIEIGRTIILVEGLVILSGLIGFGLEKTMYALFGLLIYSKVTNKVIVGIFKNQLLYIYTDKLEGIKNYINNDIKKTFSIIEGNEEDVIMFSVNYLEIPKVKKSLFEIDENIKIFITEQSGG